MSEVKVLKFVSGQEVIAKLVAETETSVVIESPLTVQAMRTAEGLGIGLVPFSFAGRSQQAVIQKTNVLCILEPEEQLSSQYLAGLSGITLASGSDLPKISL